MEMVELLSAEHISWFVMCSTYVRQMLWNAIENLYLVSINTAPQYRRTINSEAARKRKEETREQFEISRMFLCSTIRASRRIPTAIVARCSLHQQCVIAHSSYTLVHSSYTFVFFFFFRSSLAQNYSFCAQEIVSEVNRCTLSWLRQSNKKTLEDGMGEKEKIDLRRRRRHRYWCSIDCARAFPMDD